METLKRLIDVYAKASGQLINFEKSELVVSNNVELNERKSLANKIGVRLVGGFYIYLGIPMVLGRSKARAFDFLKDRVWRKVRGWKQKLLSFAGREVLLKVVVQAAPTYVMSLFKLPTGFCHDLRRLMARFWWGGKDEEKEIHWVSWDNLCSTKKEGGLGFRNMEDFNMAMLAKQGWRLMCNTGLLANKILKARYFPNSSFLESSLGSRPSYV